MNCFDCHPGRFFGGIKNHTGTILGIEISDEKRTACHSHELGVVPCCQHDRHRRHERHHTHRIDKRSWLCTCLRVYLASTITRNTTSKLNSRRKTKRGEKGSANRNLECANGLSELLPLMYIRQNHIHARLHNTEFVMRVCVCACEWMHEKKKLFVKGLPKGTCSKDESLIIQPAHQNIDTLAHLTQHVFLYNKRIRRGKKTKSTSRGYCLTRNLTILKYELH